MADDRSLADKLWAMANQSASPQEAEVARLLLDRLQAVEGLGLRETRRGPAAGNESRRVISRDRIMASPDRETPVQHVRWRTGPGRWINADLDDFELDEATGRLHYTGYAG